MRSISPKICDDKKTVFPLLFPSSVIRFTVETLPIGSKPKVGSSNMSNLGSFIKHAAIPTRVISPVENFFISEDESESSSILLINSVIRGIRICFGIPNIFPTKSK